MKKIFSVFFVLFSVSGFASTKIQVVATLPVLGDIAKKVGGEFIEVTNLAEPNRNPHRIEPSPVLIKAAKNADVFIQNGMELEIWVKNVLTSAANQKIQPGQPGHVVASDGVSPLEVPTNVSRSEGDIHAVGNPHVWLDPLNAKIMAKNMSKGLIAADPTHKADYERLLREFENAIDTRMVEWNKRAEVLKGKKFITYHKTFAYLANRFSFTIAAEIEQKPGIAPGPQHKARLIEIGKNQGVSAIIQELFYETNTAKSIGKETGLKVLIVPIDVGAQDDAKDYFSLIDLLLNTLIESTKPAN